MVVGKLYLIEASPPARAVLLTAKALDIELEHIIVNLATGAHMTPEYQKLNPQHTVPLYVDQDGTTVWDSHAINAYLVGKYGKNDALYPKSLAKRSVIDQRLHFDSGNLFTLVREIAINAIRYQEKGPSEKQRAAFNNQYDFLNKFLDSNKWMAGDNVTIADFSVITSVSSMNVIVPVGPGFSALLAWLKRCEQLPYYDVNAKGLAKFEAFIKPLLL